MGPTEPTNTLIAPGSTNGSLSEGNVPLSVSEMTIAVTRDGIGPILDLSETDCSDLMFPLDRRVTPTIQRVFCRDERRSEETESPIALVELFRPEIGAELSATATEEPALRKPKKGQSREKHVMPCLV